MRFRDKNGPTLHPILQTAGFAGFFRRRAHCTTNPYRQVARWIDEAVLDRMETRLKANPHILRQRRELVEHPFGSIKQWMNQGAFLMRRRSIPTIVRTRVILYASAVKLNSARTFSKPVSQHTLPSSLPRERCCESLLPFSRKWQPGIATTQKSTSSP